LRWAGLITPGGGKKKKRRKKKPNVPKIEKKGDGE
jgi:hypothetical protein